MTLCPVISSRDTSVGCLASSARFHLFVSQHIVSSSPCARVEGSHPARPHSGIGSEWMIGSGHLCQGFGMLRSRSPVLMNVIYTYQMCHWVTCQIFYIMPFCRTRDSWGRECLLMPWGGNEHGFFFFFFNFNPDFPPPPIHPISSPCTELKPVAEGISLKDSPEAGGLEFVGSLPRSSPFLFLEFAPRPHPNLGKRIFF